MMTDDEMRGLCDCCRRDMGRACNWDGILDDIEDCAVLRRILFEGEDVEIDSPELRDRMAAIVLRLLQDDPA